ncbi:phage head closure protein [Curvibacter sp. HBC28]|uniref:Phage head closure protein n=1 Tax=Curvibacter microcysteis TaxID=3026419 RepID=A0ABT5MCY0_9BURK|nr:phage head closure protein [Curvibacter sp. HBC28]MDD0814281.1 phage head closure protein [Curvibacter sp. HBC28]
MMAAGMLNSRVSIQARAPGRDALGQPANTWAELASMWANIRHQSGAEAVRADALVSVVRASIRVRRRRDVTASMRVVHGSVVYEIKAVLPDEVRGEFMDLVCEVVA